MNATAQPIAVPLRERIRAARRRGRIIATLFAVGAAITLILVVFLPPTYRATATILIEQQEIPQEVVRSTITSFADQRLQVISQRVMTSQNLLSIAERFNLYAWQRRTRPREVVVEKMRNDIRMKLVSANVLDPRSGRPTQATIAFTVSFDCGSPAVAVKVANELTSLYLNENIAERTRAAEQASTFLADEGARLNAEIQQYAQKLAEFKRQNVDTLPELAGVNFQLLDRTEIELRDANSRIGTIDAQKAFIEAQLATMTPTSQIYTETGQRILSAEDRLKTLKSELAGLRSKYAADHPDVLRAEREVAGLQTQVTADSGANDLLRQLEDARAQLATAQKKYSPEHPDVMRLQRVITGLEVELSSHPAVARVKAARTNPDNPAYIQLQAQLEALLAERAATVRKQETLGTRLEDLQARLAKAPAVEKEYRKLANDYDNAQAKYREVRSKQMEAQVSQNLETERKGERFTLIEPPILPEDPVSPNRPLVLIGGLVVSAALALVTAAIQEALDTSVRSARDLEGLLEVPPLVTVPVIETEEDAVRRRRSGRRAWFGAAVSLLMAVLSVHVFYRPLDLLWFAALRRMGL